MEGSSLVETVQVEHGKKGKSTIKNHGKMKDGKLIPLKKNGKVSMVDVEEIKELLVQKDEQTKEKVETKRHNGKVKFIPNGTTVDVVEKPVEPTKKAEVFVCDLVKEFAGILTSDCDVNGFTNFRSGKHVEFYAIDRKQGFIGLSTRDDASKSGWKTERIQTKQEFNAVVDKLKTIIDNKEKFKACFIPFYHCVECQFVTDSVSEMTEHIATHKGSGN